MPSFIHKRDSVFLTKLNCEKFCATRKRSEGRIKAYRSCTDTRPWMLSEETRRQFLKDLLEKEIPVQVINVGSVIPVQALLNILSTIIRYTDDTFPRHRIENHRRHQQLTFQVQPRPKEKTICNCGESPDISVPVVTKFRRSPNWKSLSDNPDEQHPPKTNPTNPPETQPQNPPQAVNPDRVKRQNILDEIRKVPIEAEKKFKPPEEHVQNVVLTKRQHNVCGAFESLCNPELLRLSRMVDESRKKCTEELPSCSTKVPPHVPALPRITDEGSEWRTRCNFTANVFTMNSNDRIVTTSKSHLPQRPQASYSDKCVFVVPQGRNTETSTSDIPVTSKPMSSQDLYLYIQNLREEIKEAREHHYEEVLRRLKSDCRASRSVQTISKKKPVKKSRKCKSVKPSRSAACGSLYCCCPHTPNTCGCFLSRRSAKVYSKSPNVDVTNETMISGCGAKYVRKAQTISPRPKRKPPVDYSFNPPASSTLRNISPKPAVRFDNSHFNPNFTDRNPKFISLPSNHTTTRQFLQPVKSNRSQRQNSNTFKSLPTDNDSSKYSRSRSYLNRHNEVTESTRYLNLPDCLDESTKYRELSERGRSIPTTDHLDQSLILIQSSLQKFLNLCQENSENQRNSFGNSTQCPSSINTDRLEVLIESLRKENYEDPIWKTDYIVNRVDVVENPNIVFKVSKEPNVIDDWSSASSLSSCSSSSTSSIGSRDRFHIPMAIQSTYDVRSSKIFRVNSGEQRKQRRKTRSK